MSEEEHNIQVFEVDELAHAVSGAAGGALSLAITYPLQTITTKLQTQKKVEADESLEKDDKDNKNRIAKLVKRIIEKDGVSGLYAGLESALYGMTITNFVYYYFYEKTGTSFKKLRGNSQLNTLDTMSTGAIAGIITVLATNPIWVANTRMTVNRTDKNTFTTIADIIKNEGTMNLYNGLKPALILVINPIIQYTIFEKLKNILLSFKDAHKSSKDKPFQLTANWAFLLGALGKIAATSFTYPYLTVKTRMHIAQRNQKTENGKKEQPPLLLDILKEEGFTGLYRGFGYKLFQSVFTVALLFYFKESLLFSSVRLLRLIRQRKTIKQV